MMSWQFLCRQYTTTPVALYHAMARLDVVVDGRPGFTGRQFLLLFFVGSRFQFL